MNSIFKLTALLFLLLMTCSQSFAMISVEFVSKERAKELGATFKRNNNGEAGVRVSMEFKNQGELEKITYIQLQIGEGKDRIMSSPPITGFRIQAPGLRRSIFQLSQPIYPKAIS